jgi:hypothetical protein
MNPNWKKQVLPGWTKYLFYAFLILCAVYFLWPWGLSITWHEWLDTMHRSKRKSQATFLQNSPLFKGRFKGVKIITQEPFTVHVQSSPRQWREELGTRFLVESKKRTPSGVHYLSKAEVLESQKKQPYDPATMGPTLQDIIDTIENWPGVTEFVKNTRCQYGLIIAGTSPKELLSVTLSPSIKLKDGLALLHDSKAYRNEVHLALTNGKLTSARLPLKEYWKQIPEVAAYDKALMVNGLELDPKDTLSVTPEQLLIGQPKGTKEDEFNAKYYGDPNLLGRTWWTAKDVTLERQDLAFVESKLNEALMKAGLSWEDIQGHFTRTSLSARHEPRWMGGQNGPIDYGRTQIKVVYRYRTERAWLDMLNPSFQLEAAFRTYPVPTVEVGEFVLKPFHRIWLIDEGRAKGILASQNADIVHLSVRLFHSNRDQQQKGFICLETKVPKPPPPPLNPGERSCIWNPYWTLWLDLETGKVTKL